MKRWKKTLISLALLVGLLVLAGFFLPARVRVERSLVMQTAPEKVYPYLTTLRTWPEWTAWTTNRFPDMTLKFEGAESGVGAVMIAEGKSSGNGVVTITRVEPTAGIGYDLDFEHGTQLFRGFIMFDAVNDGLKVTWAIEADLGANPLKRWAGLVLDKLMGGDLMTGLKILQRRVEASR